MYSMVTTINNVVLYIFKSLTVLKVLSQEKKFVTVYWWTFTRLIVVTAMQYIQISNHYVVYLKLL